MTEDLIVSNQIKCNKCGDTPFSKHRHDFVSCKCGAVSVDGGTEYLRRLGNIEDWEEMSIIVDSKIVNDCIAAVEWAKETGRNSRGTVYAMFRALRDNSVEINTW